MPSHTFTSGKRTVTIALPEHKVDGPIIVEMKNHVTHFRFLVYDDRVTQEVIGGGGCLTSSGGSGPTPIWAAVVWEALSSYTT